MLKSVCLGTASVRTTSVSARLGKLDRREPGRLQSRAVLSAPHVYVDTSQNKRGKTSCLAVIIQLRPVNLATLTHQVQTTPDNSVRDNVLGVIRSVHTCRKGVSYLPVLCRQISYLPCWKFPIPNYLCHIYFTANFFLILRLRAETETPQYSADSSD